MKLELRISWIVIRLLVRIHRLMLLKHGEFPEDNKLTKDSEAVCKAILRKANEEEEP